MSVINFTDSDLVNIRWLQKHNDAAFSSPFGSQSVEFGVPEWHVSITPAEMLDAVAGPLQALYLKLRGRTNQLALWNTVRPAPLGTMRGTMTLDAEAAQGATSLDIISAGQENTTLLAGDLLGLGSGTTQQVVMVVEDAIASLTSDGDGLITVTIEPPLRNTHAATAAVIWDKPKALFRMAQSSPGWDYTGATIVACMALDLIEDWRA